MPQVQNTFSPFWFLHISFNESYEFWSFKMTRLLVLQYRFSVISSLFCFTNPQLLLYMSRPTTVWRISWELTTSYSTKTLGRKFRIFLVVNETALKVWKTSPNSKKRTTSRGIHKVHLSTPIPKFLGISLNCFEFFAGNFGTTNFWSKISRIAARIDNAPCK